MLSIAFSASVNAESIEVKDYLVIQRVNIKSGRDASTIHSYPEKVFYPFDGEKEPLHSTFGIMSNELYSNQARVEIIYDIAYVDGTAMVEKDRKVALRLENVYYSFLAHFSQPQQTTYQYLRNIDTITSIVYYNDNTVGYFDDIKVAQQEGNPVIDIELNFTPEKPVTRISLTLTQSIYNRMINNFPPGNEVVLSAYLGEMDTDSSYALSIGQSSEESGLLSGILGWIQNIFNSVKDGFSALGQGITNIWNGIVELPEKIWQFIENGLKNLFVPTEEYIVGFKDRIDTLLGEKLGAVYQVIDITLNSWDRITASDETNSIEFPSVTIDLPNNNSFTFGGYNVVIVPQGFEFLATIIKGFIAVLCSVAFVNGLRKRYDEVMGVEK